MGVPRSRDHQPPASFVASGKWPDVKLRADAPLTAVAGMQFAKSLHGAMAARGWSDRELSRHVAMSHSTVGRIARGEVLPDLGTIVRLEAALGCALYPATLHAEYGPPAEQVADQ